MLISAKGQYALRVRIDLAEHQSDAFVSLRGIAERQEISEKYLTCIIKPGFWIVCGAKAGATA